MSRTSSRIEVEMSLADRTKELIKDATREEIQASLSVLVEEVLGYGQSEILVFGIDSKELIGSVVSADVRTELFSQTSSDDGSSKPTQSEVADFYKQLECEVNQPEN